MLLYNIYLYDKYILYGRKSKYIVAPPSEQRFASCGPNHQSAPLLAGSLVQPAAYRGRHSVHLEETQPALTWLLSWTRTRPNQFLCIHWLEGGSSTSSYTTAGSTKQTFHWIYSFRVILPFRLRIWFNLGGTIVTFKYISKTFICAIDKSNLRLCLNMKLLLIS